MAADILLTGGTGQVGTELARLTWPVGVSLVAPPRAALDLARPGSISAALGKRRFAAIISAGAYTAVDRAETEVGEAWTLNALAPAILAREAALSGIPIVHLSTDYVFDGSKGGHYREEDAVAPLNVYGASKEGGEQAVRTANPRHAIIRTAWVVGPHGRNFLTTMLRLAAGHDELPVVDDQRGCPTFAGDLAAAVQVVTLALVDDPAAEAGTYHFVNGGEASWAEFAAAIFAESSRRGGASARVRPIATSEYPTPARRPRNSRLATYKLTGSFGVHPRPWQDALREALGEVGTRP